ncbi:hypothetical protein HOT42_gp07 [Microbacterium phage Metamorphoo]|uniref:Uncharacterized protein n=1 Tax=Microbacterium phage Metamorphoo TaxID=2201437 RepID=A0A2Z4Q781_9CAUD|nr:hypothetical protein HOT42_gp07 [Microbacterium phage Metamorphoo]AWY05358.1 hypothetical protein SEA_METAMORPHOO_7 [Microbacterium phage Metamorphoo]
MEVVMAARTVDDLIAKAREAEDWPRFPAKRTAELIHDLRVALEDERRGRPLPQARDIDPALSATLGRLRGGIEL